MADDATLNDQEEEKAQDDKFSPYGGEEENEEGTDDKYGGIDDKDAEELDAEERRFEDVADEEAAGQEEEDPDYKVWKPNDAKIDSSADQHAIVSCTTSAGPLLMHFHKAWSPHGYERATSLFEKHYYDQSHFFRVVPHFLVQFGIGYTTDQELKRYARSSIPDDPKRSDLLPFREGMMSFAGSGPNSRSSQLFIAYDKAGNLGTSPWETPFGEIIGQTSLDTVRSFYQGYGDMPPWGKGPEQGPIHSRGSSYIEENFPKLDKFNKCSVRRVKEIPSKEGKEERPLPGGNVNLRKASGAQTTETNHGAARKNIIRATSADQQPLIKLFIMIGGAAIVILILGLRGRKRKKQNKSV
eukprot:scaffold14139_cov74-Cyclotella_meneghiniana.AAC.3